MAWSTRQLAELAGTSLRAVRHYHEIGLLAEPERRSNGYKSYGVAHLVRLLRIKRLTDLGFSLAQIAEMGEAEEHPEQAIRQLDAELAASIERLQRIRVELSQTLRQAGPTDLPPALAEAAAHVDLSDADRAFIVVLARVLGPSGIDAYIEMLHTYHAEPATVEFDQLPEDADEHTRRTLAERMAPQVQSMLDGHPGLLDPYTDAPRGAHFAWQTVEVAVNDLYNSAQIDVLTRIGQQLMSSAETR
ncbi:DNA-binding transcriptional MerR regulator [Nocardia tenerifensis]|uniref:DNA-binding transcriptional MerR regulator n=1 Tax=Nocardia tenerifensis TaxID=228006 RepID=A0A318KJH1_9NOCA|nr:MerR family transcriptional regulator [Nocardia tenerifensis]PXX61107.1 DNA-binding transcriptional MerR regulator [Nocardia tenerifensis]